MVVFEIKIHCLIKNLIKGSALSSLLVDGIWIRGQVSKAVVREVS